jgi:hypothetical protein
LSSRSTVSLLIDSAAEQSAHWRAERASTAAHGNRWHRDREREGTADRTFGSSMTNQLP